MRLICLALTPLLLLGQQPPEPETTIKVDVDLVSIYFSVRDKKGGLLSDNFYWHARDEQQLQQLNHLPKAALTGKLNTKHSAGGLVVAARITNSSSTPALAIKLTLRDSR